MNLLAQNPFGTVSPPISTGVFSGGTEGLGTLLSIIFKTAAVGAGIYSVFNFILAGYQFISGSGDPKRIELATSKIWQSVIGLIIVTGAVALGALVSLLVFGDATYILQLKIFTP